MANEAGGVHGERGSGERLGMHGAADAVAQKRPGRTSHRDQRELHVATPRGAWRLGQRAPGRAQVACGLQSVVGMGRLPVSPR